MKDLSLMDFNRRLKGMGKSKMGEQTGTFDLFLQGNRNMKGRTATCIVRKNQGWESLTIAVKHKTNIIIKIRPPTHDELKSILRLFFEEWEIPVQFVQFPIHKREAVTFWLSERTNQAFSNLPANLATTKTPHVIQDPQTN